ncbi:MAG: NAD(P)/FAD-dependent oxidoreductase [SAR202 cluster bacterium]|jgi:cation diffusion facilitator CzcD-associated flavoprotein CzcO|nr:MAG: NAD(P)/FAD-dependent oxidoreductase [SAR202 cluster bacterium]KAA1302249.1 MAG: NAD(P)/FAD-dependent oxidoreductase [SAR202 cluster bacterium]MCH2352583.1 NAD(P)/FAD-dependent oxidoreductase [Pseudomonadales bacterium]MCH2670807.1 NAD(P)/FAD-dependent oxidoreductase [Dehalococcoidia bacterium]|tara:strand:+ start:134 stop:1774 length:1641 start_codon:yes stop_codon:yes gene_type:complete
MTQTATNSRALIPEANLDFDAIVIGAGVAGLYQLYRLRNLGMRVQLFEAGTGVGGTWYWNRYPGARFDSESYSYGYSFSQELLDEWDWSEHFASQPEILRYLQHVADKFDLYKDIQFSSEVKSATYRDDTRSWEIQLQDGSKFKCRFLITGIGLLSQPTLPKIPGIDSFKGQSFHTSRWPHESVSYSGKRVAVIGTGATGVQTIQEICKDVGHLTVFQRRPNWCAPLHNAKIEPDEMKEIRAGYEEIFETCNQTAAGFLHTADSRSTFEVSADERYEFWENLYASKGFGIWQGNFKDVLIDPKANEAMSEFVANKIRQRVEDPDTAEKLIPKDHGFGTRRVPLETRYYESYNRDNVELVDIIDTPIEKVTPDGIVTTDRSFEFDLIIYATGFDAILGSYNKIEISGVHGRRLKDQWDDELSTFLGIQINNFPNLFMILGPHALLGNNPRSIEFNVEWITDLIGHMTARNLTRAEATAEAVESWYQHVLEQGEGLLANQIDSWMTGVNSNLDGRQKRIIARYSGTQTSYRQRCNEVVESGYAELNLM